MDMDDEQRKHELDLLERISAHLGEALGMLIDAQYDAQHIEETRAIANTIEPMLGMLREWIDTTIPAYITERMPARRMIEPPGIYGLLER